MYAEPGRKLHRATRCRAALRAGLRLAAFTPLHRMGARAKLGQLLLEFADALGLLQSVSREFNGPGVGDAKELVRGVVELPDILRQGVGERAPTLRVGDFGHALGQPVELPLAFGREARSLSILNDARGV